jgi:D-tyrosyl-tRNA(Tyr) deacylase
MRAVIQRTLRSSVTVEGKIVGEIGPGLTILLGVAPDDGPAQVLWLSRKIANLRIFSDDDGRMNRSLLDCGGGALVISQFTLYGNCDKGRRPSFIGAARPELAEPLYLQFCDALATEGIATVARGIFAADMSVSLINDGPVTLVIDTPQRAS